MKKLIFISLLFAFSCNPCKQVLKHPECFPADTVKITNEKIKYEKIFITNDSIVFDTIPCDPVENFVYKTKTVYQTKNVIRIDTIYNDREVVKLNPVNSELQKQVTELTQKNKSKTWALFILVIIIIGGLLLIKIFKL